MYHADYQRRKYAEKKAKLIELLGGKCVECGSTTNLEFDHIDPSTTEYRITVSLGSRSLDNIEEELKKCQLLCKPCHTRKTKRDMGWSEERQHGTLTMYTRGKCRCDECRKVWNEKTREYKKKHRNEN